MQEVQEWESAGTFRLATLWEPGDVIDGGDVSCGTVLAVPLRTLFARIELKPKRNRRSGTQASPAMFRSIY